MKNIRTKKELLVLKEELEVRDDWHEPDEQGLTADVKGTSFDNAGHDSEKAVILKKEGKEIARINLATLLAWATGYEEKCKLCDGDLDEPGSMQYAAYHKPKVEKEKTITMTRDEVIEKLSEAFVENSELSDIAYNGLEHKGYAMMSNKELKEAYEYHFSFEEQKLKIVK